MRNPDFVVCKPWVGLEKGVAGGSHPWKITSDYRFPNKFLYGPPSRSNWNLGVRLLLEGGPYGPL